MGFMNGGPPKAPNSALVFLLFLLVGLMVGVAIVIGILIVMSL